MSGHTAGPWSIRPGVFNYQTEIMSGEDVLATVYGNTGENLGNANVMRSAPELLDMLLALECDINTMVYCYDKRPGNFWGAMEVAKENAILARAVIAKAKGEE